MNFDSFLLGDFEVLVDQRILSLLVFFFHYQKWIILKQNLIFADYLWSILRYFL